MFARSLLPLLLVPFAIGCGAADASEADDVDLIEEGMHGVACKSGTFVLDTPWASPRGPREILPVDDGSTPTSTPNVPTGTPIVFWNLESAEVDNLEVSITKNGVAVASATLVNQPVTSTKQHDYLQRQAPHAELTPSLEPGRYVLEAAGLSLAFRVRAEHVCAR